MFAPGQLVRWLCKPLDAKPRCIYGVVAEIEAERVIIRIEGPDGYYWRRVLPKRLLIIPEELIDDMKISQEFPTKYVKAVDLGGKTVTLAISKVIRETLGHGKEQERKPVVYFEKASKGLVLNATNARAIAALYGDETDDWTGKRIAIYATQVKAFGEIHDVIRVREEIPAQPKPAQRSVVEENVIDDAEDVTDNHARESDAQ